ncbi:hypothetical protein ACFQ9Z_10525 [Streptomyces sp. NPDC056580]|uniref:hypothetical protein n=1 Tax=Streptomyces sp. NPDC056580 TaxID=3345872 RepID=UPI0036AA2E51
MTVPEENRPKTTTTDEVIRQRDERDTAESAGGGASSRNMREALDEADVRPEDMQEE